jgi:hypothetical protein
MRRAMTKGVFQPTETPSDRAVRMRSKLDVNRNAPIQSTPFAREAFGSSEFLEGSFGMTNIAMRPMRPEAPAITKKTTFQLAKLDIIPP